MRAPIVPARIGSRPVAPRAPARKPTKMRTRISGPGVVSARPRPVTISSGSTFNPATYPGGQLIPFGVSSSGALQAVTGGVIPIDSSQANPIYVLADPTGKYIYALNQGNNVQGNNANSGITGYNIFTSPSYRLTFLAEDAKGSWTSIPALVYDDMSLAQIDAIRLQVHLVGTRQWDPYSKAKYLYYLRTQELLTFAQIVDFCGGRVKEVVESINAYSDMEKYYRPVLADDGLGITGSHIDSENNILLRKLRSPSVTIILSGSTGRWNLRTRPLPASRVLWTTPPWW